MFHPNANAAAEGQAPPAFAATQPLAGSGFRFNPANALHFANNRPRLPVAPCLNAARFRQFFEDNAASKAQDHDAVAAHAFRVFSAIYIALHCEQKTQPAIHAFAQSFASLDNHLHQQPLPVIRQAYSLMQQWLTGAIQQEAFIQAVQTAAVKRSPFHGCFFTLADPQSTPQTQNTADLTARYAHIKACLITHLPNAPEANTEPKRLQIGPT